MSDLQSTGEAAFNGESPLKYIGGYYTVYSYPYASFAVYKEANDLEAELLQAGYETAADAGNALDGLFEP